MRRSLALVASFLVVTVLGCDSADDTTESATAPSSAVGESSLATSPATEPPATEPASTDPTAAPTTVAVEPLRILVTNDDGVDAPGIDALVNALTDVADVEVTVVAPAANQSGTSMSLTDGDVVATPAATAGGVEATAVAGFPADSVRWALANLDTEFDLVVSGANSGQNIGDFSALSGTVGAARYAAQQGIPAVAVSQGLVGEGEEIVFDDSVAVLLDWLAANRDSLAPGLTSINSPTCPDGVRGAVEVPLGVFDGRDPIAFDCASTLASPVDDVDAFANGFVAITALPVQI